MAANGETGTCSNPVWSHRENTAADLISSSAERLAPEYRTDTSASIAATSTPASVKSTKKRKTACPTPPSSSEPSGSRVARTMATLCGFSLWQLKRGSATDGYENGIALCRLWLLPETARAHKTARECRAKRVSHRLFEEEYGRYDPRRELASEL